MISRLLIVTIICQIFATTNVSPQETYSLSLTVVYDGRVYSVNFPTEKFNEFYRCLCKAETESCSAHSDLQKVAYIEENYFGQSHPQSSVYYDRYLCQHFRNGNVIKCSKFHVSETDCSDTRSCSAYRLTNGTKGTCSFTRVGIIWVSNQKMNGSFIYALLEINPCQPGCVIVSPPARAAGSNRTKTSFASINKFTASTPRGPAIELGNSTANETNNFHESSDHNGIIIGVVLTILLLSALVALSAFGVYIYRRRKCSFLIKTSKEKSVSTSSTPTLVQLQYIEPTYANVIAVNPPTVTNHLGKTESDIYSNTYYDHDFSDYCNNSNLSLETSMTYANNSNLSDVGCYDNYDARTGNGNVHNFSFRVTRSLPTSLEEAQEYTDEEVYEDLDCPNLKNVQDFLLDSDNFDDNIYSNVYNEHANSVNCDNISLIFKSIQCATSQTMLDNFESSIDLPDRQKGYSKLHEDIPHLKDSYDSLSKQIVEKHNNPSTIQFSSTSEELSFLAQSSIQSLCSHRAIDLGGVIDISLSQEQPISDIYTNIQSNHHQPFNEVQPPTTGIFTVFPPNSNKKLKGSQNQPITNLNATVSPNKIRPLNETQDQPINSYYTAILSRKDNRLKGVCVTTAQQATTNVSKKGHEYFELERDYVHGSGGDVPFLNFIKE